MLQTLVAFSLIWTKLVSSFNVQEVNGYYLEFKQTLDPMVGDLDRNAAIRPDELECPSDNVITTTYRCQVSKLYKGLSEARET